jgi:hypothetical protein
MKSMNILLATDGSEYSEGAAVQTEIVKNSKWGKLFDSYPGGER